MKRSDSMVFLKKLCILTFTKHYIIISNGKKTQIKIVETRLDGLKLVFHT